MPLPQNQKEMEKNILKSNPSKDTISVIQGNQPPNPIDKSKYIYKPDQSKIIPKSKVSNQFKLIIEEKEEDNSIGVSNDLSEFDGLFSTIFKEL